MSVLNNAPIVDVRKVMSGKDGGLYDENGTLLVSTESFQSSVAVNNQTYQPLGDAQEHGTMSSYKVTLQFSEIIVETSEFFKQLMEGLRTHRMPVWNFRGMVRSPLRWFRRADRLPRLRARWQHRHPEHEGRRAVQAHLELYRQPAA